MVQRNSIKFEWIGSCRLSRKWNSVGFFVRCRWGHLIPLATHFDFGGSFKVGSRCQSGLTHTGSYSSRTGCCLHTAAAADNFFKQKFFLLIPTVFPIEIPVLRHWTAAAKSQKMTFMLSTFFFLLLLHPSVPQRRQQQPAAFQHKRATRKMCPIYSARCCKWNAQAKIFGFGKIC